MSLTLKEMKKELCLDDLLDIAMVSYGKDSITMADLMLKNGMKLDKIIFTDTLMEFKMMYEYKQRVDRYFKERYGMEVTTLKPDTTFEAWCFGVLQRGEEKGAIRGIPNLIGSSCYWRREAKVKPFEKYLGDEKANVYIGFTIDEDRSVQDTEQFTYKYPLRDTFKMREDDCKAYLINQEMENPLYRFFSRTGCGICPGQSDRAWYEVYKNFPEDWEYMKWVEARLEQYEQMGYTVLNRYWFSGKRTIAEMEAKFNRTAVSLFNFSDEPLKDCFCKI